MINVSLRRGLLLSTAVILVMPVAAGAQSTGKVEKAEAPTAAKPDPSSATDIIVTGFRASNRAAVEAKRKSTVILDAISQDDIGRLPDLNVVESARRIPGLSTVGGLDPTKNRDIYQRVTIRGLDPRYNLITVDGVPLASSEWTVRGARLEQFPNSLVSRIEAIKSVTAEFDPHALGGQLNIVSRSAFDSKADRFLAINASGGINSTSGDFLAGRKPNFRADATGSIVFGGAQQIGLVVSGEYQRLRSSAFSQLPGDTNGNGWTYYTAAGTQTPFASRSRDNILVAVRPQDFRFDNDRERYSVNGKLEWKLNDTDKVSLFAGYYHDQDNEFRAEVLTTPGGVPTNVTPTSGTFPTGNFQQGIVEQPQTRTTFLTTAKGDFSLSDKVKFSLVGSYSKATYNERRIFQKWASAVTPGRVASLNTANFGYSYTITDGAPLATHNAPTLGLNPASYVNLYVRDIFRIAGSEIGYAAGSLAYNADAGDRGFGLRGGFSFTQTIQRFDTQYFELTPANAAAQAQVGGLANFIFDQRFISRDHAVIPYLVVDPGRVTPYVAANQGLFVATDQRANNFADDFHDTEQVAAAYAQALFQTDRLRIIAGARYDNTDVRADTFQVPTTVGSTAYEPVSRASRYEFWLPSALATYRLTNDMRITAGISKTIGRPDFSQYAARTSYSIGSTPGSLTINTGNPGLKPREAINYDLSYEWYLPGGGLLSLAGFYKEISNEIFTATQQGPTTTYLGITYPLVTINQPLNAASARVKGLELAYTQDNFGFLPPVLRGLGINLNATVLKGSFDLPESAAGIAAGLPATRRTSNLIQQPDYIANATLFYLKGPFEARVSFNRIGRALQQADQDTPERDLYQEARNQIDFQVRYSLDRSLDVFVQGQNVTEAPFIVRQGPGRAYLNNAFPVGSTFWIGMSWKPHR